MLTSDLFKRYVYPVAILAGSVIGVGFFSLPYIALKTSIWLVAGYLAVLTLVIILINTIVGEIALKTPDFKRIPGFVGFHLGKWAEAVSLTAATLGGFGILLVYLIVGGDFLANAFSPIFGGSYLLYVVIYFILAGIFIYSDVRAIAKVELGTIMLLLLTLLIIFIKGFANIKLDNIFIGSWNTSVKNLFLPYGPIIFSLWGVGLIPEVEELLKGDKKNIKKIITASVLITAVIYFLFIVLILGITGAKTTESALAGLKEIFGGWILSAGFLVGAVVIFNAFISLGLILKKVFMYDLGVKKIHAVIIVCTLPLILFLLGVRSFIPIISFIGGIFLGIDGILILLMYRKIKGKKVIIYPLSVIFILGVIYELVYFIN